MSAAQEIDGVLAAVGRAVPGKGVYALPWYLVVGAPGSGRTTALKSMQLAWPNGDAPLNLGVPQQGTTYWLAQEAAIIEPELGVFGANVGAEPLRALCDALHQKRPREPVDGILLFMSLVDFVDLDDRGLEAYASGLRAWLVEIGRRLHADVPVYIAVTRYDSLWGFAEVFQWGPERRREEPWGFLLPGDTPSQQATGRIQQELEGLGARIESFCLGKLGSDDPPEFRTRGFQHMAEARAALGKLSTILAALTTPNRFDRAPWVRALVIGSALPGLGDRPRVSVARFANMGLTPAQAGSGVQRPGGLPIHAFLKTVVLPERELVPLRVRWRDDLLTMIPLILAGVVALVTIVLAIVL